MKDTESDEGVVRVWGGSPAHSTGWLRLSDGSHQVHERTDEELSSQEKQKLSEGRKFGEFKVTEMKSVEHSD